jgi:Ras-related protein Rab-32
MSRAARQYAPGHTRSRSKENIQGLKNKMGSFIRNRAAFGNLDHNKNTNKSQDKKGNGVQKQPRVNKANKGQMNDTGNPARTRPPGSTRKTRKVFKVLVVGNSKCGKTSFIERYANDNFNDSYNITIGADYTKKVVDWDENTQVRLQLWDIAGQDRFANLTRPYYRDADAAVVLCDVTRVATLEATKEWKKDLNDKLMREDGTMVPTVLLANKVDLLTSVMEGVSIGARLEHLVAEMEFTKWFMASAKSDENITDAMDFLIEECMNQQASEGENPENPRARPTARTNTFKLGNPNAEGFQDHNPRRGCF